MVLRKLEFKHGEQFSKEQKKEKPKIFIVNILAQIEL